MTRTLLFFAALSLLLSVPVPAPAAPDAGTQTDLRLRSAEVFLEALAYELKKDPQAREALDALAPGAAAAALKEKAARPGLTQEELFYAVAALVPAEGPARDGVLRARQAARLYLAPPAAPAWERRSAPEPVTPPADLGFHAGGSPETAGTDPGLADWKDADGYATSRLGPLSALLDRLSADDTIVLSNLPLAALLPSLEPQEEVAALNLPISGYAKNLWLLRGPGGRNTLLLSDFQGRIYLRHFELLLRRYYSGKKAPAIKVAEAPSAYEPYYRPLARLCQVNRPACSGLEAVVAGYGESFRTYWSSWSVTSLTDAAGDWRLDIYGPDGAGRWGVITARSSFFGETLGENISRLVQVSTGIHTVVLAGSGGSLEARPLYDLVYPSHVLTPGGREVPNALGSAADFRAHRSALSPLEETPAWLARALADGVSTVDVEMGPAAELLAPRGLRLGLAVLVTDFPVHRPAIEKALATASLASQDAGAKYRGLGAYARGLGDWLLGGSPPGWQPVEKKMGLTIGEKSALNLAAEERRLAPLSEVEKKLVAKLERFFTAHPPAFSVRMSRARAARVLEDEAFLSTELVTQLKGTPVTPFTPDYEQRSYRALRYIFGTLSYWDGPEKYGDTVLRLKESAWRRRAWATRRSAMRALAITAERKGVGVETAAADPALAAEAEELFNSWIVAPEQLPRALALQVAGELRALPPGVLGEFLSAEDKELPWLIKKHDVGWLEGRLWEAARVEDIDYVKTPAPAAQEIARPAARLGIKVN